jgi:hypothetical protein
MAGLFAACTDFANPTTVVDLRVLAVQTEPSEIILDADLSNPAMPVVDPANNPGVTVTPLIADPLGDGRPVTYTISACPNNPFAAAPTGRRSGRWRVPFGRRAHHRRQRAVRRQQRDDLAADGGGRPAERGIQVFLGIDQLTAAFMADIFPDQFGNLHGGFDLGMPLTLDITVNAGDGTDPRASSGCSTGPSASTTARWPNQTPTIDTLSCSTIASDTTFDRSTTPSRSRRTDEHARDVVRSSRAAIDLDPAVEGTPSRTRRRHRSDHAHGGAVHGRARDAALSLLRDGGNVQPADDVQRAEPAFVTQGPVHIESEYTLPPATRSRPTPRGTRS